MLVLHALVIAAMMVSLGASAQAQQSKSSARKPASGQPKLAQQLFYDGFEAYKANRFKDAIGLFAQGLRQDPTNALAAFYLGEAYAKTGNQAKAQEWHAASLAADPQSEVAEQARARLATAPQRKGTPQETAVGTPVVGVRSRLDADAIAFIKTHYDSQNASTTSTQKDLDGQRDKFTRESVTATISVADDGRVEIVEKIYCHSTRDKRYTNDMSEFWATRTIQTVLSHLSANVRFQEQRLLLECTSGKCWRSHWTNQRWRYTNTREKSDFKDDSWPDTTTDDAQRYLLASSPEMAQRLAQAFTDLIRSAGGQSTKY